MFVKPDCLNAGSFPNSLVYLRGECRVKKTRGCLMRREKVMHTLRLHYFGATGFCFERDGHTTDMSGNSSGNQLYPTDLAITRPVGV